ncbi:MAG: cysteine--tRNA ligase [Lentisphaeria bacterium]
MSITFYNTLHHQEEEFIPLVSNKVGLYTCGPTVYNYAHIGNFRCYAFEDILKRTLLFENYDVNHVMNLTDVDDKTIRGSQEQNIPLKQFTQKYKNAFFEDLKTLHILPAVTYPAATEHIGDMIKLVQTLMDKGIAYQAEDKSVYFSIAKWPQYGQLVHLDPEQMRTGVRVKMDEYAKESVADFALWKAWDKNDGDVFWNSPWGKGRPGWHIECSAMSSRYLGKTFDIHCGGIDNMFPHHEDEIAQSEAANGCKFVHYWLHCAHLMVDGQKMSKSAGNFYKLQDLLDKGYTGREIRWVLIGTHYRQSLNFSLKALEDARVSLQRIDAFKTRLQDVATTEEKWETDPLALKKVTHHALESFRAGITADLNISAALAALFDFIRDINRMLDHHAINAEDAQKALSTLEQLDTVLAVCTPDPSEGIPPEIMEMAQKRQEARAAKNFAESDRLRDKISDCGFLVEDTPKGPRIIRQ